MRLKLGRSLKQKQLWMGLNMEDAANACCVFEAEKSLWCEGLKRKQR